MKINRWLLSERWACARGARWFARTFPGGLSVEGPPDERLIERLAKAAADPRSRVPDYLAWAETELLLTNPSRHKPWLAYWSVRYDEHGNARPRSARKAWRARLRVLWAVMAARACGHCSTIAPGGGTCDSCSP